MIKTALLAVIFLTASASAVVVQDYTAAEAPPPGLDWNNVYNYKNSSAVAVGANWLLTAAHVADDSGSGAVSVDGTVYNQQEIVFHPSADLALVRYDRNFPGFYALYTEGLLFDPKLTVIIVGYGTIGSVRDFGWTDNGSGRGTKRWGSQEIDTLATDGFWMDFDLVNTPYEAGTGVGDSGGGVFYEDNGVWKLAGINVERSLIGGQYKSTFAVATGGYADWIAQTVPEPEAMGLMGLGTIGLFLMRAGTRRKSQGSNSLVSRRKVCLCDLFTNEAQTRRSRYRIQNRLIKVGRRILDFAQPAAERISSRYKAYDRIFWNYMVAAHERRTIRRKAAGIAVRRKALGWLDACLERLMK